MRTEVEDLDTEMKIREYQDDRKNALVIFTYSKEECQDVFVNLFFFTEI